MDPRCSPVAMLNENMDADDQVKMQRIWEVTKIGSFDADSWIIILNNLSDEDLANVAVVCKDFQMMAQNIMKNRYSKNNVVDFCMTFANTKWKPIICRFRNVIPAIRVFGTTSHGVNASCPEISQQDFSLFEHFVSDTLKRFYFNRTHAKQLKNVVMKKKFHQLELLMFYDCNLSQESRLLSHMYHWYPNLKSLKFANCKMGRSRFLEREQSLPLVEDVKFHFNGALTVDFFLIKNPQLKCLELNLPYIPVEAYMSHLPMVNELLPNLESMLLICENLKFLPHFRKNFDNVKSLKFLLKDMGTYKDELLKIVSYFPKIEELMVLHMSQNLMTNDDLIDLLTQSSSTLKNFCFVTRSTDRQLKFGYDLHRRFCDATSNRSDILIEFEFGKFSFENERWFQITKEGIKENGKFIVVKDLLG